MFYVDVSFHVQGETIPADHGYVLLGAISKIIPNIHDNEQIGIHSINGILTGNRSLKVTPNSRLTIRLPSDSIKEILLLSGKQLQIGDGAVRVGIPEIHTLIPASKLYSRLVIIKGFTEPQQFLDAAQRQLDTLDVKGKASLIEQTKGVELDADKKGSRSPYLRRTLKIHDKNIVGFALRIEELTAEESILMQEKGIGGRRRFGCGLFLEARR